MKLQFTGRKLNIRDSFKERAEKKLSKLGRIFTADADVQVTVTAEKNRYTVEVTILDNGLVIRAESTAFEPETALDEVVDILGGQIRKHKTRLDKRLRSGAQSGPTPQEGEEAEYEVVRTKFFPLKPLYVDEAILQMNLVGHQFFVFKNSETSKTNVVYRRKNGGYGLLQPEED